MIALAYPKSIMAVRQHARSPAVSAGARFFDATVWLGATWNVWLSTYASAAQLQQLAALRLQNLIAMARERSPFYRDLYRGVPAGAYRLAELPVVSKRHVMANFDAAVTDPSITAAGIRRFLSDPSRAGEPFLDRYALWTSSGTTGEPGIYVQDGQALAVYEALQMVRFRGLQSPAQLASAWMANDRYAFVGATGGHFAGNASVHRLAMLYPWLADRVRTFSILQSVSNLSRQLNEYQPTLLATYPTAANLLADCQRRGQLRLRVREIWTGGEGLSRAQRANIAESFGCVVRDDYGASEFLSIAWDCGHGALHLNADWLLLEPVDAHYRPVPPGVASHTALLTNLANVVQPLIRYDLGDSITLLEHGCPCGSALPAIRVEGRCDEVIVLSDAAGRKVELLPLVLTTVMEDEAGVYRFQLRQLGASALRLRLEPPPADADARRCREALARYLSAQCLRNVRIEVEREPLQPHAVSGKLQRITASH